MLHPDYPVFPHPETANEDGLLAVGGTLSNDFLLTAYSFGIFPWYNEGDPILWWSPDPRVVIIPGEVKIAKSMRPFLKKFELRIDTVFDQVIAHCGQTPRKGIQESWITTAMEEAYIRLHQAGYAHSFECWHQDQLVGGLYGVSLGKCFFGESMFSHTANASKFALIRLSQVLFARKFQLIDCQIPNEHLFRMGCQEISRSTYLDYLRNNLFEAGHTGSWSDWVQDVP